MNGGPMFVTAEVRSYGARISNATHIPRPDHRAARRRRGNRGRGRGDRLTTGVYAALDIGVTTISTTATSSSRSSTSTRMRCGRIRGRLPGHRSGSGSTDGSARASRFLRYYAAELRRGPFPGSLGSCLRCQVSRCWRSTGDERSPRRHARADRRGHRLDRSRRCRPPRRDGSCHRHRQLDSRSAAATSSMLARIGRSPNGTRSTSGWGGACDLLRGSARSVSEITTPSRSAENVSTSADLHAPLRLHAEPLQRRPLQSGEK